MKKLLSVLLVVVLAMSMFVGCGAGGDSDKKIGVAMPTKDLQRWNQDGANMKEQLEAMKERRPSIGNISGKGLMLGVEFVKNKATKEPFDPKLRLAERIALTAQDLGLFLMYTGGFAENGAGDGIMFGPCFEITKEEVDKMLDIFEEAIIKVESEEGM